MKAIDSFLNKMTDAVTLSKHFPSLQSKLDSFPCPGCEIPLSPSEFSKHLAYCACPQSQSQHMPSPQPLIPCSHCKRTFLQNRLIKHQKTCIEAQVKRPVFDMSPRIFPHSDIKSGKQIKLKKKNVTQKYIEKAWHKKHERLITSIRHGRILTEGEFNVNNLYENLAQCPRCFRRFGPQSLEKHVQKCRDVVNSRRSALSKVNSPELEAKSPGLTKSMECPHCLRKLSPKGLMKHLGNCNGRPERRCKSIELTKEDYKCGACLFSLQEGSRYCNMCGSKLRELI